MGRSMVNPVGRSRTKASPQAWHLYSAAVCFPSTIALIPSGPSAPHSGHAKWLYNSGFKGIKWRSFNMAQFTFRTFQKVKIPFIIHPKLGRASLKKRSTRKMLTKNEPIIAQIAPMDWYVGISR